MRPTFVFLHVGEGSDAPTILVRSIRAQTSEARIIQCADAVTQAIDGVDEIYRCDGDAANLMTFRLQCFSGLGLTTPALYLDTDMVCMKPVDPGAVLGDADVAVCRREYQWHATLGRMKFHGHRFEELEGRKLGEVFPFVACATITAGYEFWKDCLNDLMTLSSKYHRWFGDQEAIKNLVGNEKYRVRYLPESVYGCIPDEEQSRTIPVFFHFKGIVRKPLMIEWARQQRLL